MSREKARDFEIKARAKRFAWLSKQVRVAAEEEERAMEETGRPQSEKRLAPFEMNRLVSDMTETD